MCESSADRSDINNNFPKYHTRVGIINFNFNAILIESLFSRLAVHKEFTRFRSVNSFGQPSSARVNIIKPSWKFVDDNRRWGRPKKVPLRPRCNFICWAQSLSGRLLEGCMIQVRRNCSDRCNTVLALFEANAFRTFHAAARKDVLYTLCMRSLYFGI